MSDGPLGKSAERRVYESMNLHVRMPWEKAAHSFADGAARQSVFAVSGGENSPHKGLECESGEALLANVISPLEPEEGKCCDGLGGRKIRRRI
jgi:hypothetical protein